MKCKYIGKSEFYFKTSMRPIFFRHGEVYNITYRKCHGRYNYIVYILNDINWVPYNVDPFRDYWLVI